MPSITDDRGAGETAGHIDDAETPRPNLRTRVWAQGPALLALASVLSVAALEASGLLEGRRWEFARCTVTAAAAGGYIAAGPTGRRSWTYRGRWVAETTLSLAVEGASSPWTSVVTVPGSDFKVGDTLDCWTRDRQVSLDAPGMLAGTERLAHLLVGALGLTTALAWARHRRAAN